MKIGFGCIMKLGRNSQENFPGAKVVYETYKSYMNCLNEHLSLYFSENIKIDMKHYLSNT